MQQLYKANHNLISINAFQFSALLAQNYGEVLVAGVESPAVPTAARVLATLMQEIEPDWQLVLNKGSEGNDEPLEPGTFNYNPNNIVPLCRDYTDVASDWTYAVRPVPLRELEVPRASNVGVVMLVQSPNCYGERAKHMFELYTQHGGFIYSTSLSQENSESGETRLFNIAVSRHDISKRLAQQMPVLTPRSSLDIWLDVNYDLLSSYQEFINEYREEAAATLEEVEDFRVGVELSALLETNQFPPKALAVLNAPRLTPRRNDRKGSDAQVSLQSLKAVGQLSFFPVPERYKDNPLRMVRVAEDPEVAGEFVVYLSFTMPSGGFEEQVVISGRNFKAIYSAANQLADSTVTSIQYSVDVDKYFGK